jgi:transposase
LAQADLRDKDLATQGRFLETLGMSRKEAAALLGTSYASLTEMLRRAAKKQGGKRGPAKQG